MSRAFVPALLLLLVTALPAQAQGDLSRVFPNGARQGTKVKLTFAGSSIPETATLFVEGEGIRAVGPFTKGVGEVEVTADAAPGMRQLRLVGPKGTTTPRPFSVGSLSELDEKEPNNTLEQAQRLEALPVTLNGSLPTRPDIDNFRVPMRKGECLVAAGESRALGAPTNLLVRIRDAAGVELLVQMDYRTRDPLVAFTAPADGEYLVELQDVMNNYSGINEDYVYRVTLTKGPWLDHAFPLGVQRGAQARLGFVGWNLEGRPGPGRAEAPVSLPGDARDTLVGGVGAPNRVPVLGGAHPEMVETEPNGPSGPQSLAVPGAVSGLFGERGDSDCYRFTARAGERLRLAVDARSVDSLADPVMIVTDAAGKTLATVDDAEGGRDPRLLWTAPADGEYRVLLRDLAGVSRGGAGFFYRLSVAPPEPELRLSTPNVALTLKPGEKLEVPLTLTHSFQPAEVKIRVEGLPEGVAAGPLTVPASPAKATNAALKLVLTAAKEAKPGHAPLRIIAEAGGLSAGATATWELSKDRSGTLAQGSTPVLSLVIPAP